MESRSIISILNDGGQLAIVGDNASGKSMLVESLIAEWHRQFSGRIKYIAFKDASNVAGYNNYLQKRWNSQEYDDDIPTVGELLDAVGTDVPEDILHGLKGKLYGLFGLYPLLDKSIITLSSGELRKFHLTRSLLGMPEVLIIDNPFIGLDQATRDSLSSLLGLLTESLDIHLVLVMSRVDAMPPFITSVIPVGRFSPAPVSPPFLPEDIKKTILSLPAKDLDSEAFYPHGPSPEIVRCNSVSIRYGSRTILKDFSWTVREGEHWALTGDNGSGKSTLLSLVCADNPQGYACDIALFGHRRGSGESIWEIKRHIGYVSPEMHMTYMKDIAALEIVASGLFDTVGLYGHPTTEQLEKCREWMRIFGIESLAGRPFLKLSSGEQRLCLLARAFVKDPELLILDEPMHGLDLRHCAMVREIIDTFMLRPHKTLIMVSHYESDFPSCIDSRMVLTRQ